MCPIQHVYAKRDHVLNASPGLAGAELCAFSSVPVLAIWSNSSSYRHDRCPAPQPSCTPFLFMAGSFSGHLINSFLAAQAQARGPFGQPSPQISSHGPLAFAPSMHGSFSQHSNASSMPDSSFMTVSDDTAEKIAALQAKLDRKLGPEFISQRPGPGGSMKLTYAEGWKIINLANEVFGFNGWSSSVVSLTTDFIDCNEETKRFTVGVTALVRVTLRDGAFHEDIGYGALENSKSKGAALDKVSPSTTIDVKCKSEHVCSVRRKQLPTGSSVLCVTLATSWVTVSTTNPTLQKLSRLKYSRWVHAIPFR